MTTFERDRALAERRHATRRVTRRHAIRQWWTDQAHEELPIPDPRQPIQKWQERIELALFPVGILAILFALAVVRP